MTAAAAAPRLWTGWGDPADVQPGDWFVVEPGEELFDWIELAERFIDRRQIRRRKPGQPTWGHAGVATRWRDDAKHSPNCPAGTPLPGLPLGVAVSSAGWIEGTPRLPGPCDCGAPPVQTLMIAEAEPGGAVEVPWHWQDRPHLWSTGTGLSVPAMGDTALGCVGTGYSFIDYTAIGAHSLHLWAPGLRGYIESTRHLICSQLVDVAAQRAGVQLFDDERWNGYVTPLDLGLLLEGVQ